MDDNTVIQFPNDNTVLRPTPGGRRQSPAVTAQEQTRIKIKASPDAGQARNFKGGSTMGISRFSSEARLIDKEYADRTDPENGQSALMYCSAPIISLLIKLSQSVLHDDISSLKLKLQDEIKHYEVNASQLGISQDKILQARYALCTALDEMVVSTPWGQDSEWSQKSLLSMFHGETWGGEKFFLLLERLQKEALKNIDILELMYFLLSLGFQGKYRVIENGREAVESLREDLYRQLRNLKNDFNKELSLNWKGISDKRGALIRYVPLWVVAALSGVILLAMFASFTYMLEQSSAPVLMDIQQLGEGIEPLKPVVEQSAPGSTVPRNIQKAETTNRERLVRPHPFPSTNISREAQ